MLPEEHERLLFPDNTRQLYAQELAKAAFNDAYKPSEIAIYLAKDCIVHYRHLAESHKTEAIEARKEVSAMKRQKRKPVRKTVLGSHIASAKALETQLAKYGLHAEAETIARLRRSAEALSALPSHLERATHNI